MLKKSTIVLAILLLLFVVFRVFIVDSCSANDAEYKAQLYAQNAYVGDKN